jgi:hypothetical protein
MKRRKWVHPLKGRTIKEAMADALEEKLMDKDGKGPSIGERGFWRNCPSDIKWNGLASWGHDGDIHSWDSMKDCLKYGFDIGDNGCITANDNDWHQRELQDGQTDQD